MKNRPVIHFIDVTDFTLPDGTKSFDWYREAFESLGMQDDIELVAYDGTAGELPRPADTLGPGRGIIVPGSRGPVYEKKPWIPPLLDFLAETHDRGAHILGVCFGHHALAAALGGAVEPNPRGREMGTVIIHLTESGMRDPIFAGFTSGDRVNLVHKTHVTGLPDGAVRLAFNQMTPTQAFRSGNAVGYQPHPELTPRRLRQLVAMYGPVLVRKEGFLDDAEHLRNFTESFMETPSSLGILRNFVDIISR